MKKQIQLLFLLSGLIAFSKIHALTPMPSPDQALQLLIEGNDHFVTGKMKHTSYLAEARDKLLEKQTPFAVIIGCSDSRVPPELVFDRGLGELFVVRDAGNVIGPIEMDSAVFAVAQLHVPLVVVLGHQNCGAIKAFLTGRDKYPEMDNIFPLIDKALSDCERIGADKLQNAIECNVSEGVAALKNSSMIAPLLEQKKVKIVGAYYDLTTGRVKFINN